MCRESTFSYYHEVTINYIQIIQLKQQTHIMIKWNKSSICFFFFCFLKLHTIDMYLKHETWNFIAVQQVCRDFNKWVHRKTPQRENQFFMWHPTSEDIQNQYHFLWWPVLLMRTQRLPVQVYNDCKGVEMAYPNLAKKLADTLTAYYSVRNEERRRKVLLSTNQLLLIMTTCRGSQTHPHRKTN